MNNETQAAPAEEEAAPVETEATETEAEQNEEPAASDEQQPETEGEKEKPRKRSAQRRISQLTREKHELQARLKALEESAEPAQEAAKEPRREDFDNYEEFLEARQDYKVEQRLAKEAEKQQQREAQTAQQRQQQEFAIRRESLVDNGTEAYSDFEDVALDPELQITEVMADALINSDSGHDLWYHLGQNPAKAEKIASLPPVKQVYELGRLEASLKVSKQPSKAPTPPKPVSRSTSPNSLRDGDDVGAWMEKRRKQLRG